LSRLPVRWRLTLAFAVVMAVVLTATGLFVHQRLASNLDRALGATLRSRAADVAALAQQSDTGLAEARTPSLAGQPALAQLIDAGGRVLDATPGARGRPLLDAAAVARARSGPVVVARTRAAGDQPVRLLAVPIRAQGSRLVAVVGQSLEERDRALSDLTGVLLVGGPAALLLASLAGYALAGAALRPVEAMRRRERRFVADASHELRSPLTMLRTELELMARDHPSGADLEMAAGSAIEETDRLTRLADDLLLLTRADSGRPALSTEPVSLGELARVAADRARRGRAGVDDGRVRIAVADGERVPLVPGDRGRLSQAIDNMLDNALRHARSSVELRTAAAGGRVELHVLDDGPGFPAEYLPHAWERFSRADEARTDNGAGLGLSIIRTIAEMHGGRADAANRPGGGADVWISLPA
jgi:signal transduction histidine kinase